MILDPGLWILVSSIRSFRATAWQAEYDSNAIGRLRPRARRGELAEVWMLLDLTRGEIKYIQHQVSSIQHRLAKNDSLLSAEPE